MGAALSRFELLVTLKRITIAEDAFFEHTLSEDIVRIMREIRRTHLGDIESRADTTIVDRMVTAVDDKTIKSILISCGARLEPFDIKELRDLMEIVF